MSDPTYNDAVKWALKQRDGLHVVTTSLLGKTAAHLAEEHPQQDVTDDKAANLRAHFRAHRLGR